ncbi:phosphoribosylformylglycinamidine synthase subunit PurQ [Botrimarina hoheduenensis]|uniref:phosphoribosylformylglycinamidine synthase subunit PurQ n=1 Tax=Botrimarina hoheduenensis TaxID=2528000 RepID=UPI001E2B35A5|nr:phosphoribosylformylglycinamidine synthase subunit PurQ [Botrimarina hoheduenensis]
MLRSPGANCDEETEHAFHLAGAEVQRVHVNQVIEQPALLDGYQVLCVPGGFSYGDDIAAGRVLANLCLARLPDALRAFRDAGKLMLGICNGFQVLLKTGLLGSEDDGGPLATLTWNDHGRFEARWTQLAADNQRCVFLRGIDRIELPIAHAEGKIAVRDSAALATLVDGGRIAMRYAPTDAPVTDTPLSFPTNPNGSAANAAGLCDTTGRVFGLMPHPERFVDRTQHPRWTREAIAEPAAGLRLFQNAVDFFS